MIGALVTEPGVWDIPADIYNSDACCDAPSLNAGCINDLLDECPAIARHRHPRLNTNFEPEYKPYFDIGAAAHLILLEPELFASLTVPINANDWKSDWAQRARMTAREENKIPLLLRDWRTIKEMSAALMSNERIAQAFSEAVSERSIFAKDPGTGIWRRCRPDKMARHGGWLLDYKAMESSNPREFPKQAWSYKWHRRAAWYLDTARLGANIDPQEYYFVVQSKKKPYLATIQMLDFVDIDKGRRDCEKATDIFADCLAKDEWPGYRSSLTPHMDTAFRSSLPAYAHQAIDAQHQAWRDARDIQLNQLAQSPLEQDQ